MSAGRIATLLGHHRRRYRLPLLPMMGGLALFEFIMTRLAPAPGEVTWMTQLFSAMPPQLLAFSGSDIGAASPAGFIGIGYGHPFMFVLLSAWAIRVSSGVLAGEIGRGTMDLLASRPIARWQHVVAGAMAVCAGLALLVFAAWAGTTIGLALRPIGVLPVTTLRIAICAWLLFTTWGMVGLLVGAIHREGGSAMGWLSGLIAVSFVLEYLARVWQPMARFRPFSLFTYYQPQHIVRTGFDLSDISRLAIVGVASLVLAIAVFSRRDL